MFLVYFYRGFFFLLSTFTGFKLFQTLNFSAFFSLIAALIISLSLGLVEYLVSRRKPKEVLSALSGLAFSIIIANGIAFLLTRFYTLQIASSWIYVLSNLSTFYIVGSYIYKRRDKLTFLDIFTKSSTDYRGFVKVVDTSALIDARILDVAKTGFLEGNLIVPRFVLSELQKIADSKEHTRRTKGRRGLGVLQELQRLPNINLEISNLDIPTLKSVDEKLIEISKKLNAKLITVDYNLKKIADLEGVPVLNINELATVLKPPITHGDEIQVKITKLGKEEGQGVGYLEDGTMVVVENGDELLGSTVTCIVQSFLQTEVGRIIFAKPKKL